MVGMIISFCLFLCLLQAGVAGKALFAVLNKSTQELKRHLKGTATNLEKTAEEILKLASQMKDVDVTAVLQMVNRLYSDADQLKAYADEVRAKRIVRAKPL